MAINQTVLQGQGVGHQIGGVSAADYQRVQESIERQQTNGGGGGGGGGGFGNGNGYKPDTQNWESFAWLILGLM